MTDQSPSPQTKLRGGATACNEPYQTPSSARNGVFFSSLVLHTPRGAAGGGDHSGLDRLFTRRNRTLSRGYVLDNFRAALLCSRTSSAASGEKPRHANTVIHAPPPLGMRPPSRSEILGGRLPQIPIFQDFLSRTFPKF